MLAQDGQDRAAWLPRDEAAGSGDAAALAALRGAPPGRLLLVNVAPSAYDLVAGSDHLLLHPRLAAVLLVAIAGVCLREGRAYLPRDQAGVFVWSGGLILEGDSVPRQRLGSYLRHFNHYKSLSLLSQIKSCIHDRHYECF